MDAVQILQIVKELTESLDSDVRTLRSEFHSAMLDQGVKFSRLEVNSEANQAKLESLDRVVVRGNGNEALQSTVRRIDAKLVELAQEVAEIKKAVQSVPTNAHRNSSDSSNKDASAKLMALLSNPQFWTIVVIALTTIGGAFVAKEASDSSNSQDNPAIEAPTEP